jgi:hypothetical protein
MSWLEKATAPIQLGVTFGSWQQSFEQRGGADQAGSPLEVCRWQEQACFMRQQGSRGSLARRRPGPEVANAMQNAIRIAAARCPAVANVVTPVLMRHFSRYQLHRWKDFRHTLNLVWADIKMRRHADPALPGRRNNPISLQVL